MQLKPKYTYSLPKVWRLEGDYVRLHTGQYIHKDKAQKFIDREERKMFIKEL